MEVTEVKVKVVPRTSNNKLKAFATVTFDDAFVVKDIRVIQGLKGTIVAMPTKKLTFRCYRCGHKNPLRAKFCNECGRRVRPNNVRRNPQTGRPVLQVDIAHPIQPETRKKIEDKILEAYNKEFEKVREEIAEQVGEPVGGQEFEEFAENDHGGGEGAPAPTEPAPAPQSSPTPEPPASNPPPAPSSPSPVAPPPPETEKKEGEGASGEEPPPSAPEG